MAMKLRAPQLNARSRLRRARLTISHTRPATDKMDYIRIAGLTWIPSVSSSEWASLDRFKSRRQKGNAPKQGLPKPGQTVGATQPQLCLSPASRTSSLSARVPPTRGPRARRRVCLRRQESPAREIHSVGVATK